MCPLCSKGVLVAGFTDAERGSYWARHYLRCSNMDCAGEISEDCTGSATCMEAGYCTVCGNLYHDIHEFVYCRQTEPTCTEVGYRCNCWYCVKCQQYFDEVDTVLTDVVLPADGHNPGEPVKEEGEYFPDGMYYEVFYCEICGEEVRRELKFENLGYAAPDPFTAFSEMLSLRIANAQPDETVEVDARLWYGLQWRVIEALADRADVSLKLLCYLNETAAELTVPAGFDLASSLEPGQFLHFRDLAKMLG